MEKLPIEFKEKWIAALRSGEYKQATGYLCNGQGGYCCLGVACKITGVEDQAMIGWGLPCDVEREENIDLKIPEIIKWENEVTSFLTAMNDGTADSEFNPSGKRFSFIEIADWIDAHL